MELYYEIFEVIQNQEGFISFRVTNGKKYKTEESAEASLLVNFTEHSRIGKFVIMPTYENGD